VHIAAGLQGIIDTFEAVGGLTALALLFLVLAHQPAPPGPASYRPFFGRHPDAQP
jgi:hypothetical protein